jgi:two-component system response regulator HydG
VSPKLHILVVDDDHSMAKTLCDIFKIKGYEAEAVHSGHAALEKVTHEAFDCVLSDIKMPKVDGVALYRAIRAIHPDLPVVLMTAYSADNLVKQGLQEGIIAVLSKPLDIGILLAFFVSLCKEHSIAIVDDDPQFCRTLAGILGAQGFVTTVINDPHAVMDKLADEQVLLLDMKLNDVGGLEVLYRIREQHPHLPVILVTGYRREMAWAIDEALQLGAYTCLYKPLDIEEMLEILIQIRRRELSAILKKRDLASYANANPSLAR